MRVTTQGRIHALNEKYDNGRFRKVPVILKVPGERFDQYITVEFQQGKSEEVPSVGTEVEIVFEVKGNLDRNNSSKAWNSLVVHECNVLSGASETNGNPF